MKATKKIALILVGALFSLSSYAQDFHLSQYDAAPLNTNPALTGMFMGKHRFHIHYRTQWNAVSSNPFTTIQAAWDMRINNKWSVGAQLLNFRAGATNYNVVSLLPSVSYCFPVSSSKFHMITLGISAGFYNKSLNSGNYIWGNQFINDGSGGHFDESISSGEEVEQTALFRPDFNFGAMYFFSKPTAKYNPFVGVTLFHLSQPNESFLGKKAKLPLRYLLHAGVRININGQLQFLPKIYWQLQKRAQEFTISGEVDYYLNQPQLYLLGSVTYRIKDALIITVGGKWQNWEARLSYDFNVSKLTPFSHGRGATEIGITYVIPATQQPSTTLLTCPKL